METLRRAMSETATAAHKIATPEHVAAVEKRLLSTVKSFPLLASHQFDDLGTGPGLYFIDIRFPFKTKSELVDFIGKWGLKGSTGLQKGTSRAYPNRAKKHIAKVEAGEFVPFYVGKNMNIRSRVVQHLTGKAESGTYSLKLCSRADILKGCELRVSGIVFDIVPDAYFCVEFMEAALRKKLHPIVGKQ